MDWDLINRVEVIDNDGRRYVKHNVESIEFDLQDDGKTLKMFIRYEEEDEICID